MSKRKRYDYVAYVIASANGIMHIGSEMHTRRILRKLVREAVTESLFSVPDYDDTEHARGEADRIAKELIQ